MHTAPRSDAWATLRAAQVTTTIAQISRGYGVEARQLESDKYNPDVLLYDTANAKSNFPYNHFINECVHWLWQKSGPGQAGHRLTQAQRVSCAFTCILKSVSV